MEKNKKEIKIGFQLARFFLTPVFKLMYKPKLINKKKIPKKGTIIICANHTHKFDPFLIVSSSSRTVHFMAKNEYHVGRLRAIFKFVGTIPVDRTKKDEDATERALNVLKDGGAIALFPEGTRNKTEEFLLPFKFGAVSMAKKTGATIVPAGISGKFEKSKDNNLMIRFGTPFQIGKMSLEEANEHLRKEIGDLMLENLKDIDENN